MSDKQKGVPDSSGPFSHAVPQERIVADEFVMRRRRVGDVSAMHEAVASSYGHLHPWMRWLGEPMTIEGARAFIDSATRGWPTSGGDCNYGIFDAREAVLGGLGLHDCVGPGVLEIGYWCHGAHTGQGLITRCVAALTEVALALSGVDRVEIRCDIANARSAAVPKRLGYRLVERYERPVCAPAESGIGMVWVKANHQ